MVRFSDPANVLELLAETASAVGAALEGHRSTIAGDDAGSTLREPGERAGQYRLDLVADSAALAVLDAAGVGVLSEESGLRRGDGGVVVVMDPVDGSTNASRGIPWYATSLCAVDAVGPWVALVVNLATGDQWHAVRGAGAWRDGARICPSGVTQLDDAVVVLNGYAPRHLGWRQYRALGATALDLCAVADGTVDATVDFGGDALGPWDYMGGALVLTEAGAECRDVSGRDLDAVDPAVRRSPISAATTELLDAVTQARSEAVGEVQH